MQWRIPQVRLIWALPGEGELSQNLWDMSNFGKIDFKLYEISYICLITSAIHVLISHLFSVKKRRMPVHPRMARIVLSMGRGIGERCTFWQIASPALLKDMPAPGHRVTSIAPALAWMT
jgi:hypothetical protein